MTIITPECFPTPDLALRSADERENRRVRGFAVEQAVIAEATRARLAGELCGVRAEAERVAVLTAAHGDLMRWRYELAVRTGRRLGNGIPHDASRFSTPMRDTSPNFDRIGYLGRFRDGARWDESTRTFRGGKETPAYRIMLRYGALAADRFTGNDGDVLHNQVVLPDGSPIAGNSLVRGAAARRIAQDLLERIARRGVDTSQIETGGDPMYVVTATESARSRMFGAAMGLLAGATSDGVAAWQAARYLFYQAPMTKKGSDAVTRTFLVTVGAILFGQAPVLAQDVDLRCIVAGQPAATAMPSDSLIL
ncbi:MAG TPA: hypothetical protein VH333_16815 [Pseudonocardiaceae bacterium]|jgi:hypothetical protein|nr:hypothetical protein [Pseudonocardiaceae bacterium]